jgi:hypothetical protein
MRRSFPLAALLACATWLPPCAAARAADAITEAETLMFLTEHLAGLKLPTTLRYRFEKRGSLEATYDDTVSVAVRKGAQGTVVSTVCLTGERRTEIGDIETAQGNPALLCFLERDIREMERLTGGKANHFRQQIRRTLADEGTVRETKIEFGGRQVAARQVAIKPYVKDVFRERFEKYAGKEYVFTFSKAVPGGLYRVEALIPGLAPAAPLISEAITFAAADGTR